MFKRRPGSLPQHFRLRATSGTDSPKARSGTTDTSGTYELISECFLNAPYILRHHLYRQKDEENQNCHLKNIDQEEDQTLLGKSRELLYMNFPFLLTILSNCKAFHFPWFLCVCERERERLHQPCLPPHNSQSAAGAVQDSPLQSHLLQKWPSHL